MKKKTIIIFALLIVVAIGEIISRYCMGLGDPPLSMGDDQIDYIFAPNQKCYRFGNNIIYNNVSMRCDFDLPRNGDKIFVVGDSVINGGVLTDHKKLATTILQERLDPSRDKIQVLNVSAGSWGPGNYAAYFKKWRHLVGTNDIIVLEIHGHDLWEDDPQKTAGASVGKDISLPSEKPFCALSDGFNRYFIPLIRRILHVSRKNTKVDVPKWGNDARNESAKYNLKMLDNLYGLPWKEKFMLIHKSRMETEKKCLAPGEQVFREYAKENAISLIECDMDAKHDYRDTIHPSVRGQLKLANAIFDKIQ